MKMRAAFKHYGNTHSPSTVLFAAPPGNDCSKQNVQYSTRSVRSAVESSKYKGTFCSTHHPTFCSTHHPTKLIISGRTWPTLIPTHPPFHIVLYDTDWLVSGDTPLATPTQSSQFDGRPVLN